MNFKELIEQIKSNSEELIQLDLLKADELNETKSFTQEQAIEVVGALHNNTNIIIRCTKYDAKGSVLSLLDLYIERNSLAKKTPFIDAMKSYFFSFFINPILVITDLGKYLSEPFKLLIPLTQKVGIPDLEVDLPTLEVVPNVGFNKGSYELSKITFLTKFVSVPLSYISNHIGKILGFIVSLPVSLILSPIAIFGGLFMGIKDYVNLALQAQEVNKCINSLMRSYMRFKVAFLIKNKTIAEITIGVEDELRLGSLPDEFIPKFISIFLKKMKENFPATNSSYGEAMLTCAHILDVYTDNLELKEEYYSKAEKVGKYRPGKAWKLLLENPANLKKIKTNEKDYPLAESKEKYIKLSSKETRQKKEFNTNKNADFEI